MNGHALGRRAALQVKKEDAACPKVHKVTLAGGGSENCQLGKFSGFKFWENDPYSIPDLNLTEPPNIYISGSGDGACKTS